jgi:hypothetical protein
MSVKTLPTLEEQAKAAELELDEALLALEKAGDAGLVSHNKDGPALFPVELRGLEVLEARGMAEVEMTRFVRVNAGTHASVVYRITPLGRLHCSELRQKGVKTK